MSEVDSPGKPVAVVDLSWAMYTFRHSYKNMCRFAVQDGVRVMYPTGHVYGVLRVIQELAQQYRAVVLAVDSPAPHRFEALPTYKSGRHQPTGNPFEDYKIMTDLFNILKVVTSEKNVFYVKAEGYEADDIIVSLLLGSDGSKDWSAYFNDNDILQARGSYHWFSSFHSPEVDRREYIAKKYGVELDFLPVWYKALKGDASDKVPNIIPRFPTKKLVQLCYDLAKVVDLDQVTEYMASMEVSPAFKWVTEGFADRRSDLCGALRRNYAVVCPRLLPVSEMSLKSFSTPVEEIRGLLAYYEIRDYVPGGVSSC
jgi:5'-3' exonuclease